MRPLLLVALCCGLMACSQPPKEQAAPAVDTGYDVSNGALVRCTTRDAGFTTICKTP